jgi:Fe-Mn family superoxide dismutase
MTLQVAKKGTRAALALGGWLKNTNSFLSASTGAGTRAISTATLPDLPYDYDALSPVIIPEIMQLHHKKHHQAYVNGLNTALEKADDAANKNDLKTIISLQPAIKFNGGGHINHSMFWQMLLPPKDFEPPRSGSTLEKAIQHNFGSLDDLISRFNSVTAGVQGSGWGWLAYHKDTEKLVITTTANQDPLEPTSSGLIPILGIDVWEHAYYLQYKNARPNYLKEIWKVINWADVEKRLEKATSSK